MEQEQIKALIELSDTVEDANSVIDRYTEHKTYAQKIAYLQELFDCEPVHSQGGTEQESYIALLMAVITEVEIGMKRTIDGE